MAREEKKSKYTVQTDGIGEVVISEEVIATIAALAAAEVKGVVSMVGTMPNEIIEKLGMKKLSKGVKVEIVDDELNIDLALNIKENVVIPDISAEVQNRVKGAVEMMTGYPVAAVNIRVAGVAIEGAATTR